MFLCLSNPLLFDNKQNSFISLSLSIYIYIYIHTHTYGNKWKQQFRCLILKREKTGDRFKKF